MEQTKIRDLNKVGTIVCPKCLKINTIHLVESVISLELGAEFRCIACNTHWARTEDW
jgi:hypothetical protein